SLRFDGDWAYLGTSSNNGIPTYQYQASINMPLFTSGRIRAEVVKSDLELQKIDQQKADLRNQIALDVKTALLNLQSARNEVQVANLGVQLAKEEVDQARDRFKAGVANNIEVISAQDSLSPDHRRGRLDRAFPRVVSLLPQSRNHRRRPGRRPYHPDRLKNLRPR